MRKSHPALVFVIGLSLSLVGFTSPAFAEDDSATTVIQSADGFANLRSQVCGEGQETGCDVIDQLDSGERVRMDCWSDEGTPAGYPGGSPRWFSVYVPRLGFSGWVWSELTDPATQTSVPNCADLVTDDAADSDGWAALDTSVDYVELWQGPAAPAGSRYGVYVNGAPGSAVRVECFDSVDFDVPFWTFTLTLDNDGTGYTESQCYSGDGPEHWVFVDGVQSNSVTW